MRHVDHESDSNYYTATFVADGETVDEVEFTVEDEALTEPTVPSKVGYIGEWQEYDIVAEDITVEAVYTAIVYGIEYVGLEDGTHSNASEYTIESETIVLQDASRRGDRDRERQPRRQDFDREVAGDRIYDFL